MVTRQNAVFLRNYIAMATEPMSKDSKTKNLFVANNSHNIPPKMSYMTTIECKSRISES